MKVLEKQADKKWKLELECTGKGNGSGNARKQTVPCHAKLEVETEDIFITTHSCYDGSVDYYYTIECPDCGCLTDIDESQLPDSVKNYAMQKYRDKEEREEAECER